MPKWSWSGAVVAFVALFLSNSFADPAPLLNAAHPAVRTVAAVQREITGKWMSQAEVLGTAVVLDSNGKPALGVFIDRDAEKAIQVVRALPEQVNGVPVEIRLTDKFRALRGHRRHPGRGNRRNPGISHKGRQALPIQLGTSGGWSKDSSGRICCSGTLGGLIQIGGQQYILSNWHVLEDDLVPGDNNVVAQTGDAVIQPGLSDSRCNVATTSTVATLELRHSLPDSNVDCAIARVVPGMVRSDGAILQVGPLSSQTLAAAMGQPVKKSGRTTGVTHNVITGLNGIINVSYDDECSGHQAFVKTFENQIIVGGGNSFLGDGDSGSLLIEDVPTNPRAVGLLFAGSSRNAIANPINEVLAFLGANMVGN